MKTCPACGQEWPDEDQFCLNDGTRLPEPESSLVGTEWAGYNILAKLGEGGMGAVYLGEHTRMHRKTAIKVMSQDALSSAGAVARFNREAENASRISHPNVCTIYDFGETFDGVLYLAMEYIEGESLTRLLAREGKLSSQRAAEIVRQVADGLAAAHELTIVHRDLKPDNIMVQEDANGSTVVKVVDFGIAKAIGPGDDQRVTQTGLAVGTPAYMSPEQLLGKGVDGRTDIYSLGLVLFRMLTGRLPFDVPDSEMMMARLTREPMKLKDADPDGEFTPALQHALDLALQQEPSDRCRDAATFRDAVIRAVERGDESPSAIVRPPVPHTRTSEPVQEQPASAIEKAAPAAVPEPKPVGPPAPAAPTPEETQRGRKWAQLGAAAAGLTVLGIAGWFGAASLLPKFGSGDEAAGGDAEAAAVDAENPGQPVTPSDNRVNAPPPADPLTGARTIGPSQVAAARSQAQNARASADRALRTLTALEPALASDLRESSAQVQSLVTQLDRAVQAQQTAQVANLVPQLRSASDELERKAAAATAGDAATVVARRANDMLADVDRVLQTAGTTLPLLAADIRESRGALQSLRRQIDPMIVAGNASEIDRLREQLEQSMDVLSERLGYARLDFVARIIVARDDGVVDATAFAVRPDGTLLTSRHVLVGETGSQAPRRIAIQFVGSEQIFGARLLGVAANADVAAVKVDQIEGTVPVVRGLNLRADTLPAGETVAVIGVSPRSVDSIPARTVHMGSIRQTAGQIQVQGRTQGPFFSGAAEGTSGSPILDGAGNVLGVLFGGQDGGRVVLGELAREAEALLNSR